MSSPFVLPPIAEKALRDFCRTYHGIWRVMKISGGQLEEAVYRALDYDPTLSGHLVWHPHSHNPTADIRIDFPLLNRQLGISIKSGTWAKGQYRDCLLISGHRLSGARGDMHRINTTLRAQVSDVVLSFVHSEPHRHYECFYIDADVFQYPTTATAWTPRIGQKNGHVSETWYQAPTGLLCTIKHPMSDQIWWTIPKKLCRQGPVITYGS